MNSSKIQQEKKTYIGKNEWLFFAIVDNWNIGPAYFGHITTGILSQECWSDPFC